MMSIPANTTNLNALTDSLAAIHPYPFLLGVGNQDPTWQTMEEIHQFLESAGTDHTWDEYHGNYNWLVWRKNLFQLLMDMQD